MPRTTSGACGDLWDALNYDKRIEVWHYGLGTAYFDDRGWDDLVERTPRHFPVPGSVLVALGLPLYAYGGDGPDMAAPVGWTGVSPERLAGYWEQVRVDAGALVSSRADSPVRDRR